MTAIGANLPAEHVIIDAEVAADLAGTALTLARRFAGGATLWCLAPACPEHAHHVAVEFVHPVIMGKRALPPCASTRPTRCPRSGRWCGPATCCWRSIPPLGRRASARPCGGPAPGVSRRSGSARGRGRRPGPRTTCSGSTTPTGSAQHDGRLVVLYHVLWELTHVCFEHPGLLAEQPAEDCDDVVCVTCSDEGRLGEVVAPAGGTTAAVRTAKGPETVDTTIVGPVAAGDLVLVHAGSAIAILDADEG